MKAKDKNFDRLKQAFADIHWMAYRYVDGRNSYAPGMFNDATKVAIELGVELREPLFAQAGYEKERQEAENVSKTQHLADDPE